MSHQDQPFPSPGLPIASLTAADLAALRKAVADTPTFGTEQRTILQRLLDTVALQIETTKAETPLTSDQPRVYRLGDLQNAWDALAAQRHQARLDGQPLGIATGLPTVDAELSYMLQPGLHSLQGGAGVGKTAFALQLATECRFPALYITCEMAPLELLARITARKTGTFLGRLKSGELAVDQVSSLVERTAVACPQLALLDATRVYVPAFAPQSRPQTLSIVAVAGAFRNKAEHALIVVDSLHSWVDAASETLSEYERLNAGLAALRSLAATLNCPVLYIAERNRASAAGGVGAGAGTRKIEYGAETVIELDRTTTSAPSATGEVEVILKISKNRNGAIGRPITLRFNGALQRYQEAG